jgi:hypothetical protein
MELTSAPPPEAKKPTAPAPAATASRLNSRHLLDLESLSVGEIRLILDQAEGFRELLTRDIKKSPPCAAKPS